jgi:hypothetical protein
MLKSGNFSFTAILLLLIFCASAKSQDIASDDKIPGRKAVVPTALRTGGEIPSDLKITLEEIGTGSHFRMHIDAVGNIFYEPVSTTTFVREGGEISDETEKPEKLSESQLEELIAEFERIVFFELADRYPLPFAPDKLPAEEYGCISCTGDRIISLQLNGKNKTIRIDGRCNSEPEMALRKLGDLILKLSRTVQLK